MVKKLLLIVALLSQFIFAVNDEAILSKRPEAKLSDYDFFESPKEQIPNDNVHKYFLQTPLFSDYSIKDRFVYIPEEKKAIHSFDKVYEFPIGTALVKTFSYEMSSNKNKVLLETRLLLLQETGWSAHTYVWDENQEDAFLKVSGKTIEGIEFLHEGNLKKVDYRVPNQNQCKECHALNDEISPIGPKARNMNKDVYYDNVEINQIEYLINNKIFKAHTLNEKLAVDWTDLSMSLDDRARSYLDINCGHCHIETGAANSTGLYLDLNEQRKNHLGIYKKPVATGRGSGGFKYSIVPGMPSQSILIHRMKSLDPGIMMPESGRALADKEAIKMLEEWIINL